MKSVFDSPTQIFCAAQFEEKKRVLIKIVGDARASRRDYRLSESEVLENPRWCVELRENAPLIRNDADITGFDGFYDLFQRLWTQVTHGTLKPPFSNRLHDSLQESVA